jgi:hypothetical protein
MTEATTTPPTATDHVRPLVAPIAAAAVAAVARWLTARWGVELDDATRDALSAAVFGALLGVYGVTNKLIARTTNPMNVAKPTPAAVCATCAGQSAVPARPRLSVAPAPPRSGLNEAALNDLADRIALRLHPADAAARRPSSPRAPRRPAPPTQKPKPPEAP